MPRLDELDPARLTPEQKAVYDTIAPQHTGHVRGPWAVALRVPEVAAHAHALYERLCVDTKLGKRLFELMVLTVARQWTSQFEWHTHEKYAREFGISDAAIEAIRTGAVPHFERADEQIVYDVVTELSATKALGADTYARALAAFGEELLVELISAAGLYTMVAMMLNAFDVPVPATSKRLEPATPPPVRRIVTGHAGGDVAKVVWDDAVTKVKHGKSGVLTHLWNTRATPADIRVGTDIADPGDEPHVTAPPPDGSRFVVIDYPAGNSGTMHRTETIDYVIVLRGEIDMVMDDSTVHMRAGDTMIQRGTNHAWFNRGSETARVAFVLVDAEPLGIGHPRVGE